MKRLLLFLIIAVLTSALAYSQSSGNFTYGSNSQTERCVLNNDNTGAISGGSMCGLTAGAACTTNSDCTAPAVCFNPTGGTNAGQCVDSTSGGPCTSDAPCTTPGQTCVIAQGATSGTCGVVENGVCIGASKSE